MSNLYVVGQTGHAFVKIGMTTRSVDKRIADWDTGSPFDWIIHMDLQIDPKESLPALEAGVHALLHRYRVRNEWFCADPKAVTDAVADAVARGTINRTVLHRSTPEYAARWANQPDKKAA